MTLVDDPIAAIGNIRPSQAPRSSQRPRARAQASQPRTTATSRLLDAMPAEREDLEASGNWSSQIIKNWTCTLKGCPNEGKLCYYAGVDDSANHTPIIRPILVAWSEAIKDGRRTADELAPEMHSQMMRAKVAAELTPRRRGVAAQATVAQGQPITIYTSGSPPSLPTAPTAAVALVSSPVRMPSGSPAVELSTIEKIDAFIAFCKSERRWHGEEEDLGIVKVLLKEHGESVEGMANADADEWVVLGIKSGYRKRLRMSAKRWMAAGMPVPNVA